MTVDEVKKLAKLSRIAVSEEEAVRFAAEFTNLLNYFEQLQRVDTANLAPTSQVTGLVNVSRADQIEDYGTTPDELLKAVPATEQRYIKTKRVL